MGIWKNIMQHFHFVLYDSELGCQCMIARYYHLTYAN